MNQTISLNVKPISSRVSLSATLLALLALILWVTPALAAVPVEGTVYEGKSVPGITLGATRIDVIKVYGEPYRCYADVNKATYRCDFRAANGGTITVTFVRNNSYPSQTTRDTVSIIRWSHELEGWKTTAGVTTYLAATNPMAVLEAYPHAIVKYDKLGEITQLRDASLGIQIDWHRISGIGDTQVRVTMAIFSPVKFTTSSK